jgi:hypothetical protein
MATSGSPVSPFTRAAGTPSADVDELSIPMRKFSIESEFLPPLQLHHAAIMDYQFDCAIANRPERLDELSGQGWRQSRRAIGIGRRADRGHLGGHSS